MQIEQTAVIPACRAISGGPDAAGSIGCAVTLGARRRRSRTQAGGVAASHRAAWLLQVGDLPFPYVSQVFLIERHVSGLRGQPISAVVALDVASPKAEQVRT